MKKLKQNRAASFAVVLTIYLLVTVTGIAVYNALSLSWWLSLLLADVVATICAFIFSVLLGNASVYDPYWSVQPPVILAALATVHRPTLQGILLMAVISLWAIRLTANWAYTFQNLYHQDWRYTMLREKTGALYPLINLLGIHMVPTLVVYGCVLPAAYVLVHHIPFATGSLPFLLLSVAATLLQGVADLQMHRYRRHRTTPFIRIGLWKYARHPNYLGEILMWWGVALAVLCAAPRASYLLWGATANTVLFFAVSIPMADRRQSRKEGFAIYKKQTRMLLSIPKNSN